MVSTHRGILQREKANYRQLSLVRTLRQAATGLAESVSEVASSAADVSKPSNKQMTWRMNFLPLNNTCSL